MKAVLASLVAISRQTCHRPPAILQRRTMFAFSTHLTRHATSNRHRDRRRWFEGGAHVSRSLSSSSVLRYVQREARPSTSRPVERQNLRGMGAKGLTDRDAAERAFPPDVHDIYGMILGGDIEEAWRGFHNVVGEGKSAASIWHWYIMIGLAARDPTVSIEDVYKLACHDEEYEASAIYRSLRDTEELGGAVNQQIALHFTLMHNLRRRMTDEALEAVLDVFGDMIERRLYPSSRHLNVLCIALVHLGRHDEAMKTMLEWYGTGGGESQSRHDEDVFGWEPAARMRHYTVAMMMYAFLIEGQSQMAYEVYKLSTRAPFNLPVHEVTLDLLLWAGTQPYSGIAACQYGMYKVQQRSDDSGVNAVLQHWQEQAAWDGKNSCIRARNIFRAQLFAQYPELANVTNPLYDIREEDSNSFLWKTHARLHRWGEGLTRLATSPLIRWHKPSEEEEDAARDIERRPTFKTTTFKPGDKTFDMYSELLPFVALFEEVPWEEYVLVMAWMKHLGIRPLNTHLLRTCWAVGHLIPPMADNTDANASAAGPLHGYLADWLGEESVPNNDRVSRYMWKRRLH